MVTLTFNRDDPEVVIVTCALDGRALREVFSYPPELADAEIDAAVRVKLAALGYPA